MDDQKLPVDENSEEQSSTLSQFIGSAKEVVERYTHCALCGAYLHFTHITDFVLNMTEETARCPECGVRVRKWVHPLQ